MSFKGLLTWASVAVALSAAALWFGSTVVKVDNQAFGL